jgi:PAS domain S-box-containing protein
MQITLLRTPGERRARQAPARPSDRAARWRRAAGTLVAQTLVLFFLATVLPLGASLVQKWNEVHAAERRAYADAARVAEVSALQLEDLLGVTSRVAVALTRRPDFWDQDDAARDRILAGVAAPHPELNALLFYTNDFQQHGTSSYQAGQPRLEISSRAYAREAAATGQVSFTAEALRALGTGPGAGVPVLPMAIPVHDETNPDRTGFVVASLKMERLPEIWAKVPLPAGSTVMLVDRREGRILTAPSGAAARVNSLLLPANLERIRAEAPAFRAVRWNGGDSVQAWDGIDGTPWAVVVDVPSATVFAPIYAQATRSLLVTLAVAAGTFGLLLALWLRLSRRLRALQAATDEWASGNRSHRTGLAGGDELSQLGRAFDRMADRLQASVEELQAQRDFARQVMDTMGQGLTVTDADGRFEYVNPAFARMLGCTPPQLVGATPLDVTGPEALATLLDALAKRRAGETTTYETRLRRADGSQVDALTTGVPRWRGGGTGGSIAVVTDLTERKRTEAELARRYQEAEAARSETRAVLDAANEAMCFFTPDLHLRMVNERFGDIFGCAAAEVVGRQASELRPYMERALADPDGFRELFRRAAAQPEQRVHQVIVQRWPVPRELALYSTAVFGAADTYLGRLLVFRDVTHEREVDRMKTEFVSLVSHELRTPLTSIKGYVDLLLDGDAGEVTADQRDFLGVVRSNADRLMALINDLLDISRIESGKVELRRAALDVAGLIAGAVGSLRPQFEAKGQRLHLDLPAALPAVWADADRVTQILINLLSNAHKYTPAGGEIAVSAMLDGDGDTIRVAVRDTGIGLTAEEQAQLFTKFFRARNRTTEEVGGTGLGLAITRSLVEMHGGQMDVASAPGQGSTFGFTLPPARATPGALDASPVGPAAPAAHGGEGITGAANPAETGRVLVVDDEPDIAALVRRYLERGGYRTLGAAGGDAALRLARAERPDLITLDILMPETNGLTVLEWLKSDSATAGIPVVLLSILPDDGAGRRLGAADYVAKPIEEAALLERIGRVLARLDGAGAAGAAGAGRAPRRVLVADDDQHARAALAARLRGAGYDVVESAGREAVDLVRRERPDLALFDIQAPHVNGARQ